MSAQTPANPILSLEVHAITIEVHKVSAHRLSLTISPSVRKVCFASATDEIPTRTAVTPTSLNRNVDVFKIVC